MQRRKIAHSLLSKIKKARRLQSVPTRRAIEVSTAGPLLRLVELVDDFIQKGGAVFVVARTRSDPRPLGYE